VLRFRKPRQEDVEMYFIWASDPEVRKMSFHSDILHLESHKQWFQSALNDESYTMFVFQNIYGEDVGQIRIQRQNSKNNDAIIGVSVDSNHRGKGYSTEALTIASDLFLKSNPGFVINAYIKEENLSSKSAFEKAGYHFLGLIDYKNFKSYHFVKK
jgi:RimJ/RimL family protein N-acetyltransferase